MKEVKVRIVWVVYDGSQSQMTMQRNHGDTRQEGKETEDLIDRANN